MRTVLVPLEQFLHQAGDVKVEAYSGGKSEGKMSGIVSLFFLFSLHLPGSLGEVEYRGNVCLIVAVFRIRPGQ